jgi:hypothetical protein
MDAQTALTLLVEAISIGFIALLITDFVLGLPMPSQESQEDGQNQLQVLQDVTKTSTETPLEEPPSGWLVVEQSNCFEEFSIRELKKLASKKHIKNYSTMVKHQLAEALAAS